MKQHLKNFFKEMNKTNFRLFWSYLKTIGLISTLKLLLLRLESVFQLDEKVPKPEIFDSYPRLALAFNECENPVVSIIIPVHNQWAYTYSCLLSILKNTEDVAYEVIMADDASTDETRKISDYVKNIKVVRTEENLGFLRNCNSAAKLAGGKYILFLNNDTNVQKSWLKHLVELCERDGHVGMAGSKLIYPDGKLQEAGGIIWKDGSAWNYGRSGNPMKPEYNYLKEVDYISGACIMIRRTLWQEIGGFDERYAPAYSEDVDIAFEVRKRGYKVLYQPRSVVVHFEGVSHGTDIRCGVKQYQEVSRNKFAEKWKDLLEKEHSETGRDVFQSRDRSRNRKTLLVIDHYVPNYDKDAGSRAIFQHLKLFAEMGLNVKFIGDNFSRPEPYTTEVQQMGIEVLYGSRYRAKWKDWIKDNAVYIDYIYLNRPNISMKYVDFLKKHARAKLIYLGHDLLYYREQRRYRVEKDEKFMKASEAWKGIESELISSSDIILTFSEIEKEVIKGDFPSKEVRTVPLFIYDEFPEWPEDFDQRGNLMFVAGFAHLPNVDGIIWFAKNIFPFVLKKLPDLKLYIAGSNPPEAILSLQSQNIIITGYLSDGELLKLYSKVKVVVIPLRYGAGVKGKTVEAMYYGVPIVSTGVGIEGMEGIHNIIDPKNTEEEFASEIIRIYNDHNKLAAMSRNYRVYVKEYCSKERAMGIMKSILS